MGGRGTSGGVSLTDQPLYPALTGGLTLAGFRNLGKNHYSLVHVFSAARMGARRGAERAFTPRWECRLGRIGGETTDGMTGTTGRVGRGFGVRAARRHYGMSALLTRTIPPAAAGRS